jgi:hypothetical protein
VAFWRTIVASQWPGLSSWRYGPNRLVFLGTPPSPAGLIIQCRCCVGCIYISTMSVTSVLMRRLVPMRADRAAGDARHRSVLESPQPGYGWTTHTAPYCHRDDTSQELQALVIVAVTMLAAVSALIGRLALLTTAGPACPAHACPAPGPRRCRASSRRRGNVPRRVRPASLYGVGECRGSRREPDRSGGDAPNPGGSTAMTS